MTHCSQHVLCFLVSFPNFSEGYFDSGLHIDLFALSSQPSGSVAGDRRSCTIP